MLQTNTKNMQYILNFRLQKWLYEGASVSIVCIVYIIVTSATRADERSVFQTFQLKCFMRLSSHLNVTCFTLFRIVFL